MTEETNVAFIAGVTGALAKAKKAEAVAKSPKPKRRRRKMRINPRVAKRPKAPMTKKWEVAAAMAPGGWYATADIQRVVGCSAVVLMTMLRDGHVERAKDPAWVQTEYFGGGSSRVRMLFRLTATGEALRAFGEALL